jgi:hypothetical protein
LQTKDESTGDTLSDEELTNVQDMLYGDVSGYLSESDDYDNALTERTLRGFTSTQPDSQESLDSSTSSGVSHIQSEDLSGSLKENEFASNGKFPFLCSNTSNEKGYTPSLQITATQSKDTVVEGLSPLGTLDGHFKDDVDENHSGSDNHHEYAAASQKLVPTPKSATSIGKKKSSPKSFMEGFLSRKREQRTSPSTRAVLGSI